MVQNSKIISIADWEDFAFYEKSQVDTDAYANILEFLLKEGIDISHPHCQYYEQKYIKAYTNLFFAKDKLTRYLQQEEPEMTRWFATFGNKEVKVCYGTEI